MSTASKPFPAISAAPRPKFPHLKLIDDDGEPLESHWHQAQISLLLAVLTWLWRDRDDFYAAGNMFIYYSEEQVRNLDYRGPDFFLVKHVNRHPVRRYWAVWDENDRYPDVIVELTSPTTERMDHTTKKDLYEKLFKTRDYFCCTIEVGKLEGWTLKRKKYQSLQANEHGWLWSQELGLWLGPWVGEFQGLRMTWLRFYHPDGHLVLLPAEEEHLRAEQEKQRADEAQAEVDRLRKRLAKLEGKGA